MPLKKLFSREKNPYNDIFHLTPRVGVRPKIEIVGFAHGDYTPTSLAVRSYLKKNFAKYSGLILTEGTQTTFMDKKSVPFVPKNTLPRQQKIESYFVDGATTKGMSDIARKIGNKNAAKMFLKYYAKILVASPQAFFMKRNVSFTPPKKQSERRLKDSVSPVLKGVDPKFTKEAIGFILNTRSLFMASELLNHSRAYNKPAVLICGGAHAPQVHQFIERPELALKYIRVIREPIRSMHPMLEYDLDRAENEFTLLKQEME